MTGLVERLLGRSRAPVTGVRPRSGSLFERRPSAELYVMPPPSAPATVRGDPPAQVGPTRPNDEPQRDEEARPPVPAAPTLPAAVAGAVWPPTGPSGPAPQRGTAAGVHARAGDPGRPAADDGPAPATAAARHTGRRDPADAALGRAGDEARTPESAPTPPPPGPVPRPAEEQQPAATPFPARRPPPLLLVPARPALAAPPVPARPEPEQVVEVHIGRLEVRTPSPPAALPARPRPDPAPSLESYLRRRGRGEPA
jgi:hypothetical protein